MELRFRTREERNDQDDGFPEDDGGALEALASAGRKLINKSLSKQRDAETWLTAARQGGGQ